ncbi:MAG: hypothetical protein R2731_00800 [Nocardioides sp.]
MTAAAKGLDHDAFWRAHRRQWGWQLRMLVPTQDLLTPLLQELRAGVGRVDPATLPGPELDELADAIAATWHRAADAPVEPEQLLIEYLHMELNRWGLMPAEECLLGVVAGTSARVLGEEES